MKRFFKSFIYNVLFVLLAKIAMAQNNTTASGSVSIFTADSLASGNTKDIATSFFQLALNNLIGNKKEFNFNSNPFAVMLKNNPNLSIDKYYSRYKPLRKLNFGFGIRLDSSFRFNGFTSGIKYSIIDQRDETTSTFIFERLKTDGFTDERAKLNKALIQHAQDKFRASEKTDTDFKRLSDFRDSVSIFFNQDIPYNKLNEGLRTTIENIAREEGLKQILDLVTKTPSSSLKNNDTRILEDLKKAIKKNLLWTISVNDTTYNDQFFFSNILLNTELSKGMFEPKAGANNLELNIRAACNFLKDSLQPGRNLKRVIFSFEPGINWVVRDKNNDKSFLEVKISGSYFANFSRLYAGEERNKITLNGTFRIRIYEDIWIPLEIRYEPKNGNVFGLFNIKANFTGLGKLLK